MILLVESWSWTRVQKSHNSRKIRWTQDSRSKQCILSISSVFTEQSSEKRLKWMFSPKKIKWREGTHRLKATILRQKKSSAQMARGRKTPETPDTQHLRTVQEQNVRGWFLCSSFCGFRRLIVVMAMVLQRNKSLRLVLRTVLDREVQHNTFLLRDYDNRKFFFTPMSCR